MNFLLDTHILIWSQREPWKISSEVTQTLADSRNELWISPVSIWELLMLVEKKRIALKVEMDEWLENAKTELSLKEAPLTWEVAEELRFTLLDHRDPADRLLVATAKVHKLTLVTSDERLLRVPDLSVLPNR